MKNSFVLDTSAIITFLEDEDGADTVSELLEQAEQGKCKIFVSFVTFTEIFYISIQEQGETIAEERIEQLKTFPVRRIESNSAMSLTTGRLKAQNNISFADAWIAALAIEKNAKLVHKDPEFEVLQDQIETVKLPYK